MSLSAAFDFAIAIRRMAQSDGQPATSFSQRFSCCSDLAAGKGGWLFAAVVYNMNEGVCVTQCFGVFYDVWGHVQSA